LPPRFERIGFAPVLRADLIGYQRPDGVLAFPAIRKIDWAVRADACELRVNHKVALRI